MCIVQILGTMPNIYHLLKLNLAFLCLRLVSTVWCVADELLVWSRGDASARLPCVAVLRSCPYMVIRSAQACDVR